MIDSVACRIRLEFPAQRSTAEQFRALLLRKMTALLRKIGRFGPEKCSQRGLWPSDTRRLPVRSVRCR
jgi:hypothetical protein